MKLPNTLTAWLYGTPALHLSSKGKGWSVQGKFADAAVQRWGINARVLSASLPVERGKLSEDLLGSFFDGLLPEGDMRVALSRRKALAQNSTYGLLAAYGRDVAGALSILPRDEEQTEFVDRGRYDPMSDDAIEQALLDVERIPLANREIEDSISLAGMQEKILLARIDGQWAKGQNGAPSTTILKAESAKHPELLWLEEFGLSMARAVRASTIKASVQYFGHTPALVIERYDREVTDEGVRRIHQEDMCQALGIQVANVSGDKRRESDGGPSLRSIAQVLSDDRIDLEPLLRQTALNLVLGNTDAHGKNISVLRMADDSAQLAPAYDVAPVLHIESIARRARSAMKINGLESLRDVRTADLIEESVRWGMDPERSQEIVADVLLKADSFLSAWQGEDGIAEAVDIVSRRLNDLQQGHPAHSARVSGLSAWGFRSDAGAIHDQAPPVRAECLHPMPHARGARKECILSPGHGGSHRSTLGR